MRHVVGREEQHSVRECQVVHGKAIVIAATAGVDVSQQRSARGGAIALPQANGGAVVGGEVQRAVDVREVGGIRVEAAGIDVGDPGKPPRLNPFFFQFRDKLLEIFLLAQGI